MSLLTYPGRLLECQLNVRVGLQAGHEQTVEGDGGGHGDAGAEAAAEAGVPLSGPATLRQDGKHCSVCSDTPVRRPAREEPSLIP